MIIFIPCMEWAINSVPVKINSGFYMNKKRSFKLLTKSSLIYLLFTFIAFFLSALFLTNEADEYIDGELHKRFHYSERRIDRAFRTDDLKRAERYAEITRLDSLTSINGYPYYTDTLITDADTQELQEFRKKTYIINHEGTNYRVEILKSIHDFSNLRDDIFGSLIPAFLLLALGVVLFNFALSGYFFSPLNKILQIMRNYKPGRGPVDTINTSTKEFEKMQDLFLEMIHRIDEDYNSLKEYTENMSHEIQTPLAIIRNKLENLMAREKIMQHHAGEIKLIYDEVNYLSRLGNTLNLLTKIENREFMNAVTLKTKPVIEKHVNTIKESAETKSLHIEQILDNDHRVFMDPVLFDIIIKNVLKNAVLYASSEGPVRIESFKDSLRISNSGPPLGISEEQLFKRFNRKNNSSKSLGLGLAIVKKICELNDLRIFYKYEKGRHVFSIQNP